MFYQKPLTTVSFSSLRTYALVVFQHFASVTRTRTAVTGVLWQTEDTASSSTRVVSCQSQSQKHCCFILVSLLAKTDQVSNCVICFYVLSCSRLASFDPTFMSQLCVYSIYHNTYILITHKNLFDHVSTIPGYVEVTGRLKMQDWKMGDENASKELKTEDQN